MNRVRNVALCLSVFCLFCVGSVSRSAFSAEEDVVVNGEVEIQPTNETEEAGADSFVVVQVTVSTDAEAKEACEESDCDKEQCESEDSAVAESEKSGGGGLFGVIRAIVGGDNSSPTPPKDADTPPADEPSFLPTHHQVALLKVEPIAKDDEASEEAEPEQAHAVVQRPGGWGVKSFCLDKDDNLVVAAGGTEGQLQILNALGEVLRTVPLPVVPEAVNLDPAGNFLVAGAGKVLRLDNDGKVLAEAESPVIAEIQANKDKIREQVAQQLKSNVISYTRLRDSYQQRWDQRMEQIASRLPGEQGEEYKLLSRLVSAHEQDALNEMDDADKRAWELRKELHDILKAKVLEQASKTDERYLDLLGQQIKMFREMTDGMDENYPSKEQVEEALEAQIASASAFSSISAVGSDIFIATRAAQGYGYEVWRMDENLAHAERIVADLRGCCGQMDVQACSTGLYVAENSRHQVNHFDREGNKVNSWGGREREGVRGFGSCCNPMNVAFGPDGSVYTAESNTGRIKRYSPEGELMQLIGSVELVPGCKKVSIGVTKDQKRVYMLDITRNHIIVMEAKPVETHAATTEAGGADS